LTRRKPTGGRGTRLDVALVAEGLASSLTEAAGLVGAGQVLVDDQVCDKVGSPVRPGARLRLRGERGRFVSRGGEKLDGALATFGVQVEGRSAADLGASTGGFTDCLLQRGARRVIAIDVGYGQLAWSIQQDPRVLVLDRTHVGRLAALPEPVDLVVGDLSFTSLRALLPNIIALTRAGTEAILLVKPQFELDRADVAPGGVVVDPAARAAAIRQVIDACSALGAHLLGDVASTVPGQKKGNIEHFIWLRLPGSAGQQNPPG
jgi:23S rRNA (cytidine1920-2'-O)/16S rRNA (cytidine1409-2'-O)-methyltransferase